MAKKVLHRYANCLADGRPSPSLGRDLLGYVFNRELGAAGVKTGNMPADGLDIEHPHDAIGPFRRICPKFVLQRLRLSVAALRTGWSPCGRDFFEAPVSILWVWAKRSL